MIPVIGERRTISDDKLLCHICGKGFRNVGLHSYQTHGLSADEYKIEFGLIRGRGLVAPETRERMAENARRIGTLAPYGPPPKEAALRGSKAPRSLEFRKIVGNRTRGIPLKPITIAKLRAFYQANPQAARERTLLTWLRMAPDLREERIGRLRQNAFRNSSKTHCKRGHPFNEANTRYRPWGRSCRPCDALRAAERRKRFGRPSRSKAYSSPGAF
jgi:hypothetical protein